MSATHHEPATVSQPALGTVLLALPDGDLRSRAQHLLARAGTHTRIAGDGVDVTRTLVAEPVDGLVVGPCVGFLSGLELIRRIRGAGTKTPIVYVAKGATVDERLAAYAAGADDALAPPVDERELVARLRAVRRRVPTGSRQAPPPVRRFGRLTIDSTHRFATLADGSELCLTPTEFTLLDCLSRAPGTVVGRSELMLQVWGYDHGDSSNLLGVYIGYLRRKLAAADLPPMIHTIRGVGYRFEHGT